MSVPLPGGVPRRLVLASDNAGKLRELRALLEPLAIAVDAQGALGIAPAEEPFGTFLENALAKARHAARGSGLPALADDSGLCCRALGGAPGVRSARLAGEHASDADNNAELQRRLAGQADRHAHYRCIVVALRDADDPDPLFAMGQWDGEILSAPLGAGGFGYDPFFWVPALGCTAAQLDAERKNRISHRAQAMRAVLGQLRERWNW
jgi:XTP/dITP diphosphohydrolase